MKWYIKVIKNYAAFDSRASRREFIWFHITNVLLVLAFSLVVSGAAFAVMLFSTGLTVGSESLGAILTGSVVSSLILSAGGAVLLFYDLFLFIPSLALTVRRLHDAEHSWLFLFISLIPIIGGLMLLVLLFTKGNDGANKYGRNPLEER
ncbi:MAG: DUF805 domain-containing protein [Clostridiales bacterium]|jgi:uncharacterized membrane protein YhaH (DUF805 family)|nr:DUF805 domain-containing protein [Clostridiales bacterium]